MMGELPLTGFRSINLVLYKSVPHTNYVIEKKGLKVKK